MKSAFTFVSMFDEEKKSALDRFGIGLFLVVLGAGTLLAAWLLAQDAAKRTIIDNFVSATNSGNIYYLKEMTDWASVRAGVSEDILNTRNAEMIGLPVEPDQVNALVNYYVQPENLPAMMGFYRNNKGIIDSRDVIRDVHFSGIREVTMDLAIPTEANNLQTRQTESLRLIFSLHLQGWVLKRVIAPIYLIPTQAPKL